MRVQFNRPATLALMIAGVMSAQTFGKGVHPVDASAKDDWYFKALREDGDIVVLSEEDDEKPAGNGDGDLLESNAKDIIAALEAGGSTAEELAALAERETAGKARATVLKAIAAAVEALPKE